MEPIVRSLLENDLYKFTMWQALLHSHPSAQAEYAFVCRNTPAYPLTDLKADLERELDHLCGLSFSPDELDYLRGLPYIKPDFADFLAIFRFQRKFLTVGDESGTLTIRAVGPQIHVMGFEIYVLYIVNELYFRRFDQSTCLSVARERLRAKVELLRASAPEAMAARIAEGAQGTQGTVGTVGTVGTLETQGTLGIKGTPETRKADGAPTAQATMEEPELHTFGYFDFGLRRRFSGAWHTEVVQTLARETAPWLKGTSNVYLAKELGLPAIGTMAHEYLQSFQAFNVHLRGFQKAALEQWQQEYRGELATALTDVVGMDAFLADFDLYFAKLYDGLRHDSGDPYVWGEKALAHYARLGIDVKGKRLVFSDGLDLQTALALHRHFSARCQTGFGIGTNLSNDTGVVPLNIVMKLVSCNGQPVAKLSDSKGKTLCKDEVFLATLRKTFNLPND